LLISKLLKIKNLFFIN